MACRVPMFSRYTEVDRRSAGVVQPTEDPGVTLARRLRELRTARWQGRGLTQRQLGIVLGGNKPLSVPLISSWENLTSPTPPPTHHLEAYALLFATERSVERGAPRLLALDELTPAE